MRRLIVLAFALALLGCVPPPDRGNYALHDEFNGTSLDLSLWQPNWLAGDNTSVTKPINGAELSCYDPRNATVSGGYLHLKAERRDCRANNGVTYSYASGLVNGHPHFHFQTGTIEVRTYIPGNSQITNWPAVWTNGDSWPNDGEDDIFEGLSGNACYTTHTRNGSQHGCAGPLVGWHTFGATLTENTVTYFYDGQRVATFDFPHGPQYAILNLGVGGYGGPIATPSDLLIDWVRVT